jgi:nucleoid DNA-binding protein
LERKFYKRTEASVQLLKVVTDYLLNAKTVQLGELSTFRLTVNSEGVATETEVTATQIKTVNIRFTTSEMLKEALKKQLLRLSKRCPGEGFARRLY